MEMDQSKILIFSDQSTEIAAQQRNPCKSIFLYSKCGDTYFSFHSFLFQWVAVGITLRISFGGMVCPCAGKGGGGDKGHTDHF